MMKLKKSLSKKKNPNDLKRFRYIKLEEIINSQNQNDLRLFIIKRRKNLNRKTIFYKIPLQDNLYIDYEMNVELIWNISKKSIFNKKFNLGLMIF